MRALDFYINETKNKLYIKNKDYLALASDPFKFLVDLYEYLKLLFYSLHIYI